ncbi:MAG: DUF2723 domain-containing protein, partial [Anaerolineales bacterium]|nr:DUF2723 domain-containing protein [Anaerolineales bacterium]
MRPMRTPQQTLFNGSIGLVIGLFLSRLISEQFLSGQPVFILSLTAVFSATFSLFFHRFPSQKTWPLSLLWLYVFYPTPRPDFGLAVGFTAVVAILLINLPTAHAPRRLALLALIAPLLLYSLTLAPALLPADNGEFQLVGATLGLAHPPGFPLYTLLAHLSTWLPLPLTAGQKINLLSAVLASLTLGLVALTTQHLTQTNNAKHSVVATSVAVLALATSTTFWAQAVMANIRIPTAVFATLAFYALFRFHTATRLTDTPSADRWLALFALTMSLGLTHHLSLAFMALVMGLFILWVDPRFLLAPSRWTRPCLAALLGLLPLLYLPLADPTLRDPAAFLAYALGLGFQGDFFYFHTAA